jgi:hypothetical protein
MGIDVDAETETDMGDTDEEPMTSEVDEMPSGDGGSGGNEDSKTYCDVPNSSSPCHGRKDYCETTGLYTCMDGSQSLHLPEYFLQVVPVFLRSI